MSLLDFLKTLGKRTEITLAKIDYCAQSGAQEYLRKAFGNVDYHTEVKDPGILEIALAEMINYLKTHGRPQIEFELRQIEKNFKK